MGASVATRMASQQAIEAFAKALAELLGGCADLTGSVFTNWSGSVPVTRGNKKWLDNLKQRRAARETHDLNSMTELAKSMGLGRKAAAPAPVAEPAAPAKRGRRPKVAAK